MSPLFKKRKREKKKAGGRFPADCCVLQTLVCSLALSLLLARLEMKMAPLFLSLGPNCSESAAPETLRCTRVGGTELSPPCAVGPT